MKKLAQRAIATHFNSGIKSCGLVSLFIYLFAFVKENVLINNIFKEFC